MSRSYTPRTIKLLFGTATHCAYPGCQAVLVFKDRGLLTPTAEIAHIRSGTRRGPRYDSTYPTERIDEFENLLLLCGQHHTPVDKHESSYTVEELLTWKRAQESQGGQVPTTTELAAIARKLNEVDPIPSSAILRGPIVHLSEAERFQQAEERLSEAPIEAAELFDQVATKLESSRFGPHAAFVREKMVEALEAGDEFDRAARERIALGWRSYQSGHPARALHHVREVNTYQGRLRPESRRALAALSAVAAFGYDRNATLEDIATAFDNMSPEDGDRLNCGLALAEQAVTWRRPVLLTARHEALTRLAESAPQNDSGQAIMARITMCLADASSRWDELVRSARSVHSTRLRAWIAARHGRYLTLNGDADAAIDQWLDAVELATQNGINESSAEWLYSLRTARLQYLKLDSSIDDVHRLAQALKATGGRDGSVLPEPYSFLQRAESAMLDQKWSDALVYLHQYLTHAVVAAEWTDENIAHERLGDLFSSTGKWQEARTHYIRSGRNKKLEKLASQIPEEPVEFDPPERISPIWERIACFHFAAACADLMPDKLAQEWAGYSYQEVTTTERRVSPAHTFLPAFKAFSHVADAAPFEIASAFLEDAESGLRHRRPGVTLVADEYEMRALVQISQRHHALCDRVLEILCWAALYGGEFAKKAVFEGQAILRERPALVAERLSGAAADGETLAALALVLAGSDLAPVVEVAQREFARDITPLSFEAGMATFGTGVKDTALLVTALGEVQKREFMRAMLVRANDNRDPLHNRGDALSAIRFVGPTASDSTRSEIFDELLRFSTGPIEGTYNLGFGNDPFSRFRVLLNEPSLPAEMVHAASSLAYTSEHFKAIRRAALTLLPGANDIATLALARALRGIPASELDAEVPLFANHQNRWLRCVAAVAWSREPTRWPDIGGQLVSDRDANVRYALATSLGNGPEHRRLRARLTSDPRRSVRRSAANPAGTG